MRKFEELIIDYPRLKSNKFFETPEFLENFDIAFFIMTSEGEVVFCNNYTKKIFCVDNDFNFFVNLISPSKDDLFEGVENNLYFKEISWSLDEKVKYGELNIKKVDDYCDELFACSLRDITHRKHNEKQKHLLHKEVIDELTELNEHMLRTCEMISRGKLNYALNHHINKRIREITKSSEKILNHMIEVDLDDFVITKELITIKSLCNEMSSNIESIQSDNKEKLQVEQVDIKKLVTNIYGYFESLLALERINFSLDCQSNFTLDCSPATLESIFIQLFQNSIDALKNQVQSQDQDIIKSIKVCIFEDSNHYQVAIEDNGEEISERDSYRIFEPYYTTKSSDHLGLGLTLVRNYLNELNGDINFHQKGERKYFQLSFSKPNPRVA